MLIQKKICQRVTLCFHYNFWMSHKSFAQAAAVAFLLYSSCECLKKCPLGLEHKLIFHVFHGVTSFAAIYQWSTRMHSCLRARVSYKLSGTWTSRTTPLLVTVFRNHPWKLLLLYFLGFTVGTMCNYKQVPVADLTTSFLSVLTTDTYTHGVNTALSLFLPAAGNRKNLQTST